MGHLYVVQGNSGLIKVGRTISFKTRLISLKREFKNFGDVVARTHCCEFVNNEFSGEYRLIDKLKKTLPSYAGREWFASGDFETVCGLADKSTEEVKGLPKPKVSAPISKEEMDRLNKAGQEKRRLALVERKKWADAKKVAIKERKALRAVRQFEILTRNAEKLGFKVVAINETKAV